MLGDQKTAMFVIISDTDDTFNFIVAIMYTQLFNLLCDKADDEHGGRLPYHVRLLLDEFSNIGQIPKFDTFIKTWKGYPYLSNCDVITERKEEILYTAIIKTRRNYNEKMDSLFIAFIISGRLHSIQ